VNQETEKRPGPTRAVEPLKNDVMKQLNVTQSSELSSCVSNVASVVSDPASPVGKWFPPSEPH
jgi:hypothetical protein